MLIVMHAHLWPLCPLCNGIKMGSAATATPMGELLVFSPPPPTPRMALVRPDGDIYLAKCCVFFILAECCVIIADAQYYRIIEHHHNLQKGRRHI